MKNYLKPLVLIVLLIAGMSAATVYRIRDIQGDKPGNKTLWEELRDRYTKTQADTTFVKVADLVTPTSFDTLNITNKATVPTVAVGANSTDAVNALWVQNELRKMFGLDSMFFDTGDKYLHYYYQGYDYRIEKKDSIVIPNWTGLKTGMVAAWEFDETSGTTAYDAIGSLNGTLTSATPNATGKIGKAVSMGAGVAYVEIPDNAVTDQTNNFTVSFWYKLNSLTGTRNFYLKGGSMYGFRANTTFQYRFISTTLSPTGQNTSGFYATTGEWVHIANTFKDGVLSIYQNGVFKESLTFTGSISTDNYTLSIGTDINGTEAFDGYIDQFIIHNRVLTTDEILLEKQLGDQGKTVAQW